MHPCFTKLARRGQFGRRPPPLCRLLGLSARRAASTGALSPQQIVAEPLPEVTPQQAEPPPPAREQTAKGFHLGGFFVAIDPNIGLWNDRTNPNWRLTFTDGQTKEKKRVPFAFSIKHRGPHVELAVRVQFGFVSCDGSFEDIPQSFTVQNGWEVTFPLPLSAVRFCTTVISPDHPSSSSGSRSSSIDGAKPATATIYCIDCPIGFSMGVQKAMFGAGMQTDGMKGIPEYTFRGELAMVAFVVAAMWAVLGLVTLPSSWREFYEELEDLTALDDDPIALMFDALDFDGDGFITRGDVHSVLQRGELSNAGIDNIDPDAFFDKLDANRSGRVSFEQFDAFMQAAQEADNQRELSRQRGLPPTGFIPGFGAPGQVDLIQPFGGAFQPGGTAVGPGVGWPSFPGSAGVGPRSTER